MTSVKLTFLEAGSCTHPEFVVLRGGALREKRFGASVAVIEHPTEGVTLFDTGYSSRFFEVTRKLPNRIYATVTPVNIDESQTARAQLERTGIRASDVRRIVISHFHADHAGAIGDFPTAEYVYHQDALSSLTRLSAFGRLKAGFLRELVPDDIESRSLLVSDASLHAFDKRSPLGSGFDLYGDGSVVLVDLPGHAPGHVGLFVQAEDQPRLLISDACWLAKGFRENILPHPVTRLITHDAPTYARTLAELHRLHVERPELSVVPCHCGETHATLPYRR